MEGEDEPKHHIGYRILAYIYELLFFGSLVWLLVTCNKKGDWEKDAILGISIMILSGFALIIIHHPHNKKDKNK